MAECAPEVPFAGAPGDLPTCIIVMGMAGSGKTAFVQALTSHLNSVGELPYTINLDPAVHSVPYPINIDIRDTVKYKEVMKQYGLGPNGAIMTSLNLFATKFDQVLNLIQKKSSSFRYIVIDTPGQIEVFTWSASGVIITETLGSTFPTVVVYVMDTPRSHTPVTFMSNMLYACSILYKTRLPFIVALNKTDIIDCDFALEWMRDFESFQEALKSSDSDQENYMSSLTHSMSLVLDDFYSDLRACGISSVTGEGLGTFMVQLKEAEKEYQQVYKPEKVKLAQRKLKQQQKKKTTSSTSSANNVKDDDDLMCGRVTSSGVFIQHARRPGDDDDDMDDQSDEDDVSRATAREEEDTVEQVAEESFQRFVGLHLDGTFADKKPPKDN